MNRGREAMDLTKGSAAPVTCAWRTGAYACRVPVGQAHRCAWHAYWLRRVEAGNLGQQQEQEFAEWWEQFQPWGHYAENHGPWWAAIDVLWPALSGLADPPVMTTVIRNELLLRRSDVRRFLTGSPAVNPPWPRLHGLPLPAWHDEHWQAKALAVQAQRERDRRSSEVA